MKQQKPPQAPAIVSGDAQVSPEADPAASGADSRPGGNFARWQEAALLSAFRRLAPRERIRLLLGVVRRRKAR